LELDYAGTPKSALRGRAHIPNTSVGAMERFTAAIAAKCDSYARTFHVLPNFAPGLKPLGVCGNAALPCDPQTAYRPNGRSAGGA
jgi:hypothetical protein